MRLVRLGCVLAAAGLLAGCSSKADPKPAAKATAPQATATATATKTPSPLTSPDDVAACAQLEQVVQAVSSLVGHTTEGITQALHPKALAKQMATAQHSLLDSVKLVQLVDVPKPLAGSQKQFEDGLRMFAADFGRAKDSAAKGNINKAADQTVDEKALRKLQESAKRIDDLCGR